MRNSRFKKEPILPGILHALTVIIEIIWKIIKIFWYWIERLILVTLLIGLIVGLAWWLSQRPSLYRDWLPAESILPEVSFSGNIAMVKNVRNHIWKSDKDFIPGYYDGIYNLDEIESVYYSITPFSNHDGPAHTMLSFGFSGGQYVVISAEVRKERGEDFDAIKGILNQFELLYVISDESDVIKLRTNYRKNEVYMYPIRIEKDEMRMLFRSMLIRTDRLTREPEFYNTLWNNCTTSILDHANALRDNKLSGGVYRILPAHSDEVAYAAGLIDTSLPIEQARSYYRIDEIARTASENVNFSSVIRRPIH